MHRVSPFVFRVLVPPGLARSAPLSRADTGVATLHSLPVIGLVPYRSVVGADEE
jgi:hypothetical protein